MTGSIEPLQSYFVRLATGKVLGPLFRDDVLWLRGAEAIGFHTPVLAPGEREWAPLEEALGLADGDRIGTPGDLSWALASPAS